MGTGEASFGLRTNILLVPLPILSLARAVPKAVVMVNNGGSDLTAEVGRMTDDSFHAPIPS